MATNTADLLDEDPLGLQSCQTQFIHFGARVSFEGIIRTVRCYDDTVLVKQLLAQPGRGHVLVIDGGGSYYSALMGYNTAVMAANNGWEGLVINGVVRDVETLAPIALGIKARGCNPRKPAQLGQGTIDVPVSFGSVTFWPGAYLWSDSDGVVTPTGTPPAPRGR